MDDADELSSHTLRPLIRDIVRTRYCIPDSLFLVESLEQLAPTRSGKWRAVRLLLGDGELCVQGLLTLDMHRYVDHGDIVAGCYVRLHSFEFCSEEVVEGGEGTRVVYLSVEDFTVVGWCDEYAEKHSLERPPGVASSGPSRTPPRLETRRNAKGPPQHTDRDARHVRLGQSPRPEAPGRESDLDSEDGFEPPNPAGLEGPAEAEALVDQPILDAEPPSTLLPPVALPRDWKSPHHPLKLTTLTSIPHLPYRQNWSVNTLAVVASLSPLESSTFPPYTQRTARLADPTTEKRVQLTVFLDAEAFTPREGAVVLLAGVKNHLFDGGSLKKYVSDRPRNGVPWWIEEPEYRWCEGRVRELREWWASQADSASVVP